MMKIALLFPGYGNQHVGMGKEIYDNFREVQEAFDEASHCLGINFVKLCFASSDAELSTMRHAYTALFLVTTSLARLVIARIPSFEVAAGYNNGEMSAICTTGALNAPDGLYFLNKYTTLCESFLSNNAISAASISGAVAADVEDACFRASSDTNSVSIALYESMTKHIITGDTQAVAAAQLLLQGQSGVHTSEISPAVGLHSSRLLPVMNQLKMYLEKIDFKDTKAATLNTANGSFITQGAAYKQHVLQHIISPVYWMMAVEAMALYDCVIQIGPGTALADSLKIYYPHKKIYSINTTADINLLENINIFH